nr:MAG TPA: hypothetical protein [Caudoviricetes sp.]
MLLSYTYVLHSTFDLFVYIIYLLNQNSSTQKLR